MLAKASRAAMYVLKNICIPKKSIDRQTRPKYESACQAGQNALQYCLGKHSICRGTTGYEVESLYAEKMI